MARTKKRRKGKLYYFAGRNTGVYATNAKDARKRKRRGGNKIVKVRQLNSHDRKQMRRRKNGKPGWSTVRRDGKPKGSSRYGRGRGQGPKRRRKK